MKAAVLGENGVEVRDLPKPEPKPNEILIRVRATSLNRADLSVAIGPPARPRRRRRRAARARMRRRSRGGRQRGERLQGRRPRDGGGARRLRRIYRRRRAARDPHPRQQHDLRAGRLLSGRAADHAQCHRHRRPLQGWRDVADPGRELRRRADGHADRQAQGRVAGDWHVDPCRPPRAAEGIWLRSRASTPPIRPGRSR